MNAWQTVAAVYGIASAAACSLFGPGIVRAVRAFRRPSEAERAAAAQARTGVTAQEVDDTAFVRLLEAELKDYAAIYADLYDTRGEL